MPYSQKEFKESNVNYLNKDFSGFKNSLMEYAKTYFSNTYKDFNETSPGMMLIEMSAYVGDVLSFYIDQQYKEMLLPLAEEKRNIVNIAKMLGYKTKPIVPAYVELTVKQTVDAVLDELGPTYGDGVVIDKGWKATSAVDSDIVFETIEEVDFTTSGSVADGYPLPVQSAWNATTNVVTSWNLERTVKAVSGETVTKTFTIGAPSKFLELTLPETNIIEILDIYDANNNRWYEVDYLAQDKVPKEIFYANDTRRSNDSTIDISGTSLAYDFNGDGIKTIPLPVPYSLSYIKTDKRFIVETNDDNTTSLVFGNGLLRNGQKIEGDFFDSEQVGITIPGTGDELVSFIDPAAGDKYSTLGETPSHTVITVKYRVGGGIGSNVIAGDLTAFSTPPFITGTTDDSNLSVTNTYPARGGASQESPDEIRNRAKAFFATQNRCVTKEDYEARTLNMPARFGKIAKVYVDRAGMPKPYEGLQALFDQYKYTNVSDENLDITEFTALFNDLYPTSTSDAFPTISLYTLSYDNNKDLVRLENLDSGGVSVPHLMHTNLKNYLNNYRILTDEVNILPGYIINFGVVFSVIAHNFANKQEVKLRCIEKIKEYFNIDKMQFKQSIYVSNIEYELMNLEGVRAVNYVTITQGVDYNNNEVTFSPSLYYYHYSGGNWVSTGGTAGYGYKFNFENALNQDVIRPSVTPAVFELKNPNENIRGIIY